MATVLQEGERLDFACVIMCWECERQLLKSSLLSERAHGNERGTFQSAAGLLYSFGFRSKRLRQMIERIGEGEERVSLCYH